MATQIDYSANYHLTPPHSRENSVPETYGPELPQGWKRKRRKISQSYWAIEQDDDSLVPFETRLDLVRQHGNFTLAYSTAVQPRLMHAGDACGYIAYRKRWNIHFALGDPVAPVAEHEQLLQEFVAQHGKPSFVQVSQTTANLLRKMGYYTTPMGIDTTLHLDSYSFKGKQKEWLRYAANWIDKREFEIREADFNDLTRKEVEILSEAWRKTRTVKRKEVRFLNRPIVLQDEPEVRKFYLFGPEQRLMAFIFLDPIFQNGNLIGYATAFKRRHPDAPQYAEHALMKRIIETLQNESIQILKLGLSPLAIQSPGEYAGTNWLTHKTFEWGYRSKIINRRCYHVQGHASYKRRFRGEEENVYYASPKRTDFLRLMALLGLCGIA